jgi:hypothetical protein
VRLVSLSQTVAPVLEHALLLYQRRLFNQFQ